jgi:hypothetical protein
VVAENAQEAAATTGTRAKANTGISPLRCSEKRKQLHVFLRGKEIATATATATVDRREMTTERASKLRTIGG